MTFLRLSRTMSYAPTVALSPPIGELFPCSHLCAGRCSHPASERGVHCQGEVRPASAWPIRRHRMVKCVGLEGVEAG